MPPRDIDDHPTGPPIDAERLAPFRFGELSDEEARYDTSRTVIVPVPYDRTTTYGGGTRNGPRAIIEASRHLELYDMSLDRNISADGIHTLPELVCPAGDPVALVNLVRETVSALREDGKFVVTLGGEHTVAVGAARAHRHETPELSVLQLDAHADLRDSFEESRLSHACVARRLLDDGPVAAAGIRSMSEEELPSLDDENYFLLGADAMRERGIDDAAALIASQLADDVYLTFDLDFLDPSVMPSTGTPEPGGFLFREALALIRRVSQNHRIVGFDLCELAPIPGLHAPDFLAAKLLYKILGYALPE